MRPSRPFHFPILKRSSYYDSDYRQSAALIRARRPYIFKNALTGVAIAAFAIGVCMWPRSRHKGVANRRTVAFTLHAVGQDTFDDVVVPSGNSQPPKTPNVGTNGVR
jgi:cytochrome c oxidase assembly factor 3, fungi type